jgi:hypothetical protein
MIVDERQYLGITLDGFDPPDQSAVDDAVAPPLQHVGVDVGENNLPACAHDTRLLERQIAPA